LSKDKVTPVFEYINKDKQRLQGEAVVSERFSDLSLQLSDNTLLDTHTSDSELPTPSNGSSSAYQLHSSPPLPTPGPIITSDVALASDSCYENSAQAIQVLNRQDSLANEDHIASQPLPISSSDSEFPSIGELITTTLALEAQDSRALTSITVRPPRPTNYSSSAPLSTVPDAPEANLSPPQLLPLPPRTTVLPTRSTSKVSIHSFTYECILVSCYCSIDTNIPYSVIGFRWLHHHNLHSIMNYLIQHIVSSATVKAESRHLSMLGLDLH